MARRTVRLRSRKDKFKMDTKILLDSLDYHEGLSYNQVKIILLAFGFNHDQRRQFDEWMYGQTCPIVQRHNHFGKIEKTGGVYEYDLFRWIAWQKKGTPLIWD